MIEVHFTPSFLRQLRLLPFEIQEEAAEKTALFKNRMTHRSLKVHKLHGRLKGRFSFSVNYKIRIVFSWMRKDTVVFLGVGDHNVYNE